MFVHEISALTKPANLGCLGAIHFDHQVQVMPLGSDGPKRQELEVTRWLPEVETELMCGNCIIKNQARIEYQQQCYIF